MEEVAEAATSENEQLAVKEEIDSPSKSKPISRKPPCRQKFEEELNEIKLQIDSKEQLLQRLIGNGKENPQSKLQQLRDSRDAANQKRRSINSQLEALNQQINNKRDATSQLRSKLQYQTEGQVEEVVRRLETQLKQHSFRLAEERRLVAEIDKLRRSKKAVKQYNDSKDELTQLRDLQQRLRVERDEISRELLSLRATEDTIHSEIRKNRDTVDILKKELDELYEHKRSRVSEFKSEQSLYMQSRDQRRAELNRQRAQEKLAQCQSRAHEREEIKSYTEPYLEERQLCSTLLCFLTKLDVVTPGVTPSTPASCSSSIANTPITPDESRCRLPGFRESEECLDSLFVGVPKKSSRKVKRSSSRTSFNKKRLVPLTPDLLAQFATLSVAAPTSYSDVPVATEALKAKQKLYSRMADEELRLKACNESEAGESLITVTPPSPQRITKPPTTLCLNLSTPESLNQDVPLIEVSSQSPPQSKDSTSSLHNGLADSTDL